jgi:4-amino-4-deoxy-L-arabinose transferase-like glycosyltransferase
LKIFSDNRLPFWLLTINAIVWLILLPLYQDGMFMDGVQYAAVARNLAKGIGSFWFPVFSDNYVAGLNSFHEHPPLVYYLQSFFFKIFGFNNIYPERIYGLAILISTSYYIILIWKKVFAENISVAKHWWLPILLWVAMPIVFWAYVNNVHEITVSLFTTAAVYYFVCATEKKYVYFNLYFLLGVSAIVFAFLSKGFPALFPLVFFAIHFLVYREKTNFSKAFVSTIAVIILLIVAAIIVLANSEARASMHIWFFDRMVHRIANNPVAGNHFYILEGLFTEQLTSLLLCILLFFTYKLLKIQNRFNTKHFYFFIWLAFSGSLPLMLTLVQRNFYFVPSLPLFAIAWAIPVANGIEIFSEKLYRNTKVRSAINLILIIAFSAGILTTFYKAGNIKREKEMLQDVYTLSNKINNTTVCVPAEIMWNNWQFRCYMMRYNDVAFSVSDTCLYYVDYKNAVLNQNYKMAQPDNLIMFQLLEKI